MDYTIPRAMSTQHPDNVHPPFFAEKARLSGEEEVKEAFYVYSHLLCDEQMWDCEGKEVDTYVVKKLLTNYGAYFNENILGQDKFLTFRVPNPEFEKPEAKVLLETLESIPRSFDAATLYYGKEVTPIFEVILPMATSSEALNLIYYYYANYIVGRQNKTVYPGSKTIGEWIGNFNPKNLSVIPLFEDKEHMLQAHTIVGDYLKDKVVPYQRVFFARSDPSMNYGIVGAVLINKLALLNIQALSEEMKIPLYPILGFGSAPFRGNLTPRSIDAITKEYPSVHTYTIQSAFKYDNDPAEVAAAVKRLREAPKGEAHQIDSEKALDLIERCAAQFRNRVSELAPVINAAAPYIPKRRKRKLHVGLFGYSRKLDGVSLPRAITFTAALYSIGLPPELLGLNAIQKDDLPFLRDSYLHLKEDIEAALPYYDPDGEFASKEINKAIELLGLQPNPNKEYIGLASYFRKQIAESATAALYDTVMRQATMRGFLG